MKTTTTTNKKYLFYKERCSTVEKEGEKPRTTTTNQIKSNLFHSLSRKNEQMDSLKIRINSKAT